MYAKSSITLFLTAATLIIHGVTANRCATVGPGNAFCRAHPDPSANVVHTLGVGSVYNYDCRDAYGITVNGDSGWDYNTDFDCWVWEVRTDDNCCPTCLSECVRPCGGFKSKRCVTP